jgi:hypothetical protein
MKRTAFKRKPPKDKPCKVCKEVYAPMNSKQTCCTPICAIRFVNLANEKKEKAATKVRMKAMKQEAVIEDVRYQHRLTQKVFNKARVLQELAWFDQHEIAPYCISCLKENMDWCCGHFKTVGAQGILRYDRRNTYLQCNKYCNMSLSGNIEGNKNTVGYKKGLIHRFGATEGQSIIDYCEATNQAKKWLWDEIRDIRDSSRAITKSQ